MNLTLNVPLPPPLSACYTNVRGRGRVKTNRYKKWQAESASVVLHAQHQRIRVFNGPVHVDIEITQPDKRRRDLDNMLKALLDLLVELFVLKDDSQIEKLCIAWRTEGHGATIVVKQGEI